MCLQLDLVADILSGPGVLLTTYTGVRLHADLLLPGAWSYVVLDEGHKIRNPDAAVTVTCKQVSNEHLMYCFVFLSCGSAHVLA